ncbi:YicC/YloC family endoribonuclease [Portibacter marinus]|uniref:YicC/YloC family endoribonuclease n=1 Tax=Portibacter marinus TaxID=2898660 RepID=UPI001F48AF71|nr:YicC/YloC family endoribonuclease [Portibacter marinus]
MVLSMTGYGRAQGQYKDRTITVELKSLNGKSTDIRCKLPLSYREKELELRKLITDRALRGKFDFSISTDDNGIEEDAGINKNLFISYYNQIKQIEEETGMPTPDYAQAILRIPNVVQAEGSELKDAEYEVIKTLTLQAVDNLTKFRKIEGKATEEDLRERIAEIEKSLAQIEAYEKPRLNKLKDRLKQNVQEYSQNTNLDQNRMEQEILYYMEKMDINEEKSRLAQHCVFFIEELDKKSDLKGRTLNFIAQEIGREINTMGAKAQFSEIQKLVVNMKNELEKIKEQLANIV